MIKCKSSRCIPTRPKGLEDVVNHNSDKKNKIGKTVHHIIIK